MAAVRDKPGSSKHGEGKGKENRGRRELDRAVIEESLKRMANSNTFINVRVSRGCAKDESRPLGIGWHEQVPNELELLCPKDMEIRGEYEG